METTTAIQDRVKEYSVQSIVASVFEAVKLRHLTIHPFAILTTVYDSLRQITTVYLRQLTTVTTAYDNL